MSAKKCVVFMPMLTTVTQIVDWVIKEHWLTPDEYVRDGEDAELIESNTGATQNFFKILPTLESHIRDRLPCSVRNMYGFDGEDVVKAQQDLVRSLLPKFYSLFHRLYTTKTETSGMEAMRLSAWHYNDHCSYKWMPLLYVAKGGWNTKLDSIPMSEQAQVAIWTFKEHFDPEDIAGVALLPEALLDDIESEGGKSISENAVKGFKTIVFQTYEPDRKFPFLQWNEVAQRKMFGSDQYAILCTPWSRHI